MIISTIGTTVYMWYTKTPEFPLGPKSIRWLLTIRAVAGFFGVSGMFFSLQYLPISDATVISFLAPPLTCFACSYLLKEPFTRMEQIATAISFFGVVLITQSTAGSSTGGENTTTSPVSGNGDVTHGGGTPTPNDVTPQQRLLGVAFCMVGVLGGGTQLVCLRWVGNRVHPLISVNYLNVIVAIITGALLTILPGLGFAVPSTGADWFYLSVLTISGVVLVRFIFLLDVAKKLFH
jgi:drug/metabolite transporter (DMT)-like permease